MGGGRTSAGQYPGWPVGGLGRCGGVAGRDGPSGGGQRGHAAYLAASVVSAAVAVLGVATATGPPTRRSAAASWTAVLAGSALVVGAAVSFMDSHIFWPRGVLTMTALAAGWTTLTWVTTGTGHRTPATSTTPTAPAATR